MWGPCGRGQRRWSGKHPGSGARKAEYAGHGGHGRRSDLFSRGAGRNGFAGLTRFLSLIS